MIDINNIEKYRENNRIEAKKALGGLPESIWETYSAFANTLGGVILLGVEEYKDKSFHIVALSSPRSLMEDFLSGLNDQKKVSVNILTEKNIQICTVDNKDFIAITVPCAHASDKPVYIGNDPFSGTYFRNGEGDYRASKEDVENMLKSAKLYNKQILDMTADSLDKNSVNDFLRLCSPFSRAVDFYNENLNISVASLLMFGKLPDIKKLFPHFDLKYTHGKCTFFKANLFDFYVEICRRLKLISDDPEIYQCLQEAALNALINADYSKGGVEINVHPAFVSFTNAGSFIIKISEAQKGGISVPKNHEIRKFFAAINALSSTGSGIPYIYSVWQKHNWSAPVFDEDLYSNRITLTLYFYKTESFNASAPPHIAIETIIEYLTDKIYVSVTDVAALLNVSLDTAQLFLNKMAEQNIIIFLEDVKLYKLKDR